MSIGVSPRLFAASLISFVGLMTDTFVDPPVGAGLFTYFATVSLLTSQPAPWGARNAPAALSYETSSWALIWDASVPLPLVINRSLATNTAFAFDAIVSLSMMISFLPTIGMSAARAAPALTITPRATASADRFFTDILLPRTTPALTARSPAARPFP
jgi:hypothetical protein